MTKHELKILPLYYDAVQNGAKRFEIRRTDRDFRVGDSVDLREWLPDKQQYGRARLRMVITYVLMHEDFPDGIPEGYCVFGMEARA